MMGDDTWLCASWISWNHQPHHRRWKVARTVLMERWIWRYFSTAMMSYIKKSFPKKLTRIMKDKYKCYIVYDKQSGRLSHTSGQWIPGWWSMTEHQHISSSLFSKNWCNTVLLCYHTHHILHTLSCMTYFGLRNWRKHYMVTIQLCKQHETFYNRGSLQELKGLNSRSASKTTMPAGRGALGQTRNILKGIFITCKP
jgi:hypothetical protein